MLDKICRTRGHLYIRHFQQTTTKAGTTVKKNKTRIKQRVQCRQGMSNKPAGTIQDKECRVLCTRCGTVSWQPDNFDRTEKNLPVLV